MQLTELFSGELRQEVRFLRTSARADIRGITSDSRQVEPGFLFAALRGTQHDGAEYIEDAVRAGAVAVLSETDLPVAQVPEGIPVVLSDRARHVLALAAAKFYGTQPAMMAAVTGTDGKTSVAHFTRQLWQRTGFPAASIGTLGVVVHDQKQEDIPDLNTTPDPVILHQSLDRLRGMKVNHCILEASSIGMEQCRLDGVHFRIAAFTSFARDHLDYHGTMEAYFQAKARLFSELMPEGSTAVIYSDDERSAELIDICRRRNLRLLRYGLGGKEINIHYIKPLTDGLEVEATIQGEGETIRLPLYGEFQAKNVLCALGIVLASGGERDRAVELLPELKGVPGRMEKVATHACGAPIFVDYAHTPNALKNVLRSLRAHAKGRLHVVFGCGGDRDHGKRQPMAEIAKEFADVVIVTDDNPRTEDPAHIRREIMQGCPEATEVGDRREAIYHAVRGLAKGDILVIAGKGHEKYQIIGEHKMPFDDAAIAERAVVDVNGKAA